MGAVVRGVEKSTADRREEIGTECWPVRGIAAAIQRDSQVLHELGAPGGAVGRPELGQAVAPGHREVQPAFRDGQVRGGRGRRDRAEVLDHRGRGLRAAGCPELGLGNRVRQRAGGREVEQRAGDDRVRHIDRQIGHGRRLTGRAHDPDGRRTGAGGQVIHLSPEAEEVRWGRDRLRRRILQLLGSLCRAARRPQVAADRKVQRGTRHADRADIIPLEVLDQRRGGLARAERPELVVNSALIIAFRCEEQRAPHRGGAASRLVGGRPGGRGHLDSPCDGSVARQELVAIAAPREEEQVVPDRRELGETIRVQGRRARAGIEEDLGPAGVFHDQLDAGLGAVLDLVEQVPARRRQALEG